MARTGLDVYVVFVPEKATGPSQQAGALSVASSAHTAHSHPALYPSLPKTPPVYVQLNLNVRHTYISHPLPRSITHAAFRLRAHAIIQIIYVMAGGVLQVLDRPYNKIHDR